MRRLLPAVASALGAGLLAALLPMGTASADPGGGGTGTVRVSVAADGTQGNDRSFNSVLSRNGRYIAFASWATNLVPDPIPTHQLRTYLRDLREGTVELVTLDGTPVDICDFSASGDRMLIKSGDRLYVRDLPTGLTQRVDVDLGEFTGGYPRDPRISGSGRYVAFAQSRPPGSTAAEGSRVYVRDLLEGTTQWVSRPDTATGTYYAGGPAISDDGQRIAYSNLTYPSPGPGPTPPAKGHAYLLDRSTGEEQMVDVAQNGSTPERALSGRLSMSADGNRVLFTRSDRSPVTANDQNSTIFIRDLTTGTTRPNPFSQPTSFGSLSADGRFVLLLPAVMGPNTSLPPAFMWNLTTDQAQLVTLTKDGYPVSAYPGQVAAMTGDGRTFAFESRDSDIVPADTNGTWDVFVRTLPPES
ncbi:hypothetical protein NBG84_15340 [Streptomyces sp. CWNU-1]|uniref:Uncharacterized protein n=1 Tax=Streptomyces albipurpureus TaxID=2897419 RepID=A0ABT0UQJ3_9ACTN|nr:hypothetical protein [Streptomyces sp. CWNU-1]